MPVVSVAETSESSLFAKVDIYWYFWAVFVMFIQILMDNYV